ncbi:MAG: biotin/lipoyl-binding protein [Gemmatimonadetes bacterium]|nr:biotin/lipoyl-binding protein [Gemmatimonadota bacterium]
MRYYVDLGGRTVEVELGDEGVRVDGRSVEAVLAHAEGTPVRGLMVGVETYRLVADRGPRGRWQIHLRGRALELDVVDERTKAIRDMTGPGAGAQGPRPVVAPMPGMVVKVEVVEGDVVQAGQGIVIVEAMKMENELKASGPGKVVRVHVRRGDAVEKDQILVDLDPLETAS